MVGSPFRGLTQGARQCLCKQASTFPAKNQIYPSKSLLPAPKSVSHFFWLVPKRSHNTNATEQRHCPC